MKRRTGYGVLLVLLGMVGPVEAQSPERPYDGEVRFDLLSFGNFFQAPADALETDVTATRVRARVGTTVDLGRPLKLYGEFGRVSYNDLGGSNAVGGGVQYLGRPQSFRLSFGLQTDRPTIDVGDEFDRADVTAIQGEYGYRSSRDWEWKGLLTLQFQGFDLNSSKDNTLFGTGAAVRYRGFGYLFSPEIGVIFGGRGAVDSRENHSQNDLYVKVRSVPAPPLYLSVQYRHRTRNYSSDDRAARNFGRTDTRKQLTALAEIHAWSYVYLNVYYALQNGISTLPSRSFTTQMLTIGMSLRTEPS